MCDKVKLDSRIPKPSGMKRTAVESNVFKFTAAQENLDRGREKIPLSELNNKPFFTSIKRARSPDLSSRIIEKPKLRRSVSLMDLRPELSRTGKRFQPTLETIPSKRLKTGLTAMQSLKAAKPLPIKTQAKKTAILNTVKSASSSNVVTVVPKKLPVTKSVSSAAAQKFVGGANKSATTTSAPTVKPASKNIAARPAPYDFKARHALAVENIKVLKGKNEELKNRNVTLEEINEQNEQKELELKEKLEAVEQEVFEISEANAKLKEEIEELKTINGNLTTKNTALANSLATTADELNELKIKQVKLEETARNHNELLKKAGMLEQELANTSNKLVLSHDHLYQINIERMILHNMVLDLRGNIRVFARVRPPLEFEHDKLRCQFAFVDEASMEITCNENVTAGSRKQTKHEFAFDHVFDPNSTQEEIFEMVSPLIQSALDGYNVCIFAYGQTGSGKTFTMEGIEGNIGIIPRTVKLLFDSVSSAGNLGWNYTITASFLEIYNEVLYDLLSNEDKEIEIRMANAKSKTEIYVSNIEQKEVTDACTLYGLMRIASSNRATAATIGNDRSSRSHAVTRLEIVGRHASRPESLVGFINLVDLAGSESPKTSLRMEETKSINRSLSELSNVILALVQKNEHVPYRNSKLTHLLMPSLGGNSKTLMFVNVSPFQEHFTESVKSLRFAAQVNACKMAKARRNRQMNVSSVQ